MKLWIKILSFMCALVLVIFAGSLVLVRQQTPHNQQLVFASRRDGDWELYSIWIDGTHLTRLPNTQLGAVFESAWSPDGEWLLFTPDKPRVGKLFLRSAKGEEFQQISYGSSKDRFGTWSPDGKWIVFASNRVTNNYDLNFELFRMTSNGQDIQQLTDSPFEDQTPAWSPDGKWIAFTSLRDNQNADIYRIHPDGTGLERLTFNSKDDVNPTWSPDSRYLAFESYRNQKRDIYRLDLQSGELVQLTNVPPGGQDSASAPAWSMDGEWITFTLNYKGSRDIYLMRPDGSDLHPLNEHPADDWASTWRPPLDMAWQKFLLIGLAIAGMAGILGNALRAVK